MTVQQRPLFVITGTTGSGKNSLGIEMARRLSAEVLSLDSMKVYRGMDIGTAKPGRDELAAVKHHLIDIYDPIERVDLARFLAQADEIIAACHARSCPVIAVGGTAMYLTGLLYGVHEGPSRDEAFRTALRQERDEVGVEALHARLFTLDPQRASEIHPSDYQRIERALEIHALSGKKPSELEANWFAHPRYPARVIILTWPREVLRRRIDERVDRMMDRGLIDEVKGILERGGFSREAAQAIGYREVLAHLEQGMKEEELRQLVKTKTWQFAKRQLTWMNRFAEAERIVCAPADTVTSLADRLEPEFRRLWDGKTLG